MKAAGLFIIHIPIDVFVHMDSFCVLFYLHNICNKLYRAMQTTAKTTCIIETMRFYLFLINLNNISTCLLNSKSFYLYVGCPSDANKEFVFCSLFDSIISILLMN